MTQIGGGGATTPNDEDDDDDWIFDPALNNAMTQGVGGGPTTSKDPLLDFQLRPVGARRIWRNVLNKERFEATLQQHRDITPNDSLGEELTHALLQSTERQITSNSSLTPHSTVHFAMQSSAFTHAFQSTTFTGRKFKEGSERLDTYLQALVAKLSFNKDFTPDDTFTVDTTFVLTSSLAAGTTNNTDQQSCCAQYRHKVPCHHQEQGRPVLCSCHRHHEGLGGC